MFSTRKSPALRRGGSQWQGPGVRQGRALGRDPHDGALQTARAASVPGHPFLAGQADSVRKRAMSPIVLPRNERAAAGRRVGRSVRSGAQGSRGRWGCPRPLRPAGSGRKWGHRGQLGEGLGWEVRVPHPVRPALPAGAAEAREGAGGQPEEGGRPGPGRADRGGGEALQVQRRGGRTRPCSHPPVGRPLSIPLVHGDSPLAQPQARWRGRRRGRLGSARPHVRALPGGGVPGRARAVARGGRGVPRTPSLLLLLPPRPPLPLPSS